MSTSDHDHDDNHADNDDVVSAAPKVLWMRRGLEPHSGGLGIDVTFMLMGGAAGIGLTLAFAALLRNRSVTLLGEGRVDASEPARVESGPAAPATKPGDEGGA